MKPKGELRRWCEISAQGSRAEVRAGGLVRAVGEPRTLTRPALSRIRATILANEPDPRRERGRHFARWWPGLATAMLLFSTTAAGTGFWWRIYAHREPPDAAPASPGMPASPPSGIVAPHRGAPGAASSEPSSASATVPETMETAPIPFARKSRAFPLSSGPAEPSKAIASAVEEPHPVTQQSAPPPNAPTPALTADRSAAPTAAPEAAPTSVPAKETEAHVLAEALSQLNRERNPRRALATLDRYDRLFAHGLLAAEARRLRLAGLVESGDHSRAVALLDDEHGFVPSLGLDLLLLRAELRAEASRCPEALDDFDRVVHQVVTDGVLERGLYGRAICFGKLGQNDRARADLLFYRRRFPHGRFSAEVARLLGEP